jgi:hypothetical protein
MKAKKLIWNLISPAISFYLLVIGMRGLDTFGTGWLWLGLFFTGAFLIGFQTKSLLVIFFGNK